MGAVHCERTALILIGARSFPDLDDVADLASVEASSRAFKEYASQQAIRLGISAGFVLDLFDAPDSPGSQLEQVEEFLEHFNSATRATLDEHGNRTSFQNVILHYVGHGLLVGERGSFALAVRYTKQKRQRTTSIMMDGLAETIKLHAKFARKYVILDCCFAGKAVEDWLPGDAATSLTHIVSDKTAKAFADNEDESFLEIPPRGTAMVCAADKDNVARGVHPKRGTTLFTGALLDALRSPRPTLGLLSLQDLNQRTWQEIRALGQSVRPILFCTEQKDGDISQYPFFPRTNSGSFLENKSNLISHNEEEAGETNLLPARNDYSNAERAKAPPVDPRAVSCTTPSWAATSSERSSELSNQTLLSSLSMANSTSFERVAEKESWQGAPPLGNETEAIIASSKTARQMKFRARTWAIGGAIVFALLLLLSLQSLLSDRHILPQSFPKNLVAASRNFPRENGAQNPVTEMPKNNTGRFGYEPSPIFPLSLNLSFPTSTLAKFSLFSGSPDSPRFGSSFVLRETSLKDYEDAIAASKNGPIRDSLKREARALIREDMSFKKWRVVKIDQTLRMTTEYTFMDYSPETNILRLKYARKMENDSNGAYETLENITAIIGLRFNKINRMDKSPGQFGLDCNQGGGDCVDWELLTGKCDAPKHDCSDEKWIFAFDFDENNESVKKLRDTIYTLIYKIDRTNFH
jgi:Caspase domain